MLDAKWISYFEFSNLIFRVNYTEYGKARIKDLCALMNGDYQPALGTPPNVDSGRALCIQVYSELFKGDPQPDDVKYLRAFVLLFGNIVE